MKINVKTLKGSHFEIEVKPEDTVTDVKKQIEAIHGQDVYPSGQQMLIHQGTVLKDPSTLLENNVSENSFLVIMLSKPKSSSSGASTASAAPATQVPPASSLPPTVELQAPAAAATPPPATAPNPPVPASTTVSTAPEQDVYGQAASNLVAGTNFEQAIHQILNIGGGSWDRETVVRALRAAYNNPERAIEYLYSGIPEQADLAPVARAPPTGQVTDSTAAPAPPANSSTLPSGGPNANPLDLFPQGLPSVGSDAGAGSLDFLRNRPQFQALRAMVQANPQILQPMLQELGKQNPHLMRLIQDHQADFLRLLNEPVEGAEGNLLDEAIESTLPQGGAVPLTPEEHEAIERLEGLGFDRALVLEVFFACNKNEELAANYLLDHMHEFDE